MLKLEDLLIDGNQTILDAMESLSVTGQRIMFLAPGGILTAALTDGDIRKYLTQGGSLNDPVFRAANRHPISLTVEERFQAKDVMKDRQIDALPILDRTGRIVDIVFANGLEILSSKESGIPVVINAGGLGTRLQPYTNILPKPLIPLGDKPISERIMDRFAEFGSREFYMIVNFKKNMIRSYFSEEADRPYQLDFVEEHEFLGSGGGLCLMKGMLNDTFFFSNCDTLLDVDYGDAYRQHKKDGSIITIICANKHVTVPYGVIDLAPDGSVGGMREKPEFTYLTNTGVYIVEPRVVEELEDGKFQGFPDIIQKYRDLGERIGVYSISEDSWIDIGQLEELQRIQDKFNNKTKS